MAMSAGTRLGPYEILAPIGAGGMGEVYRARDSRLSREVAIKVLPGHLSADPQAVAIRAGGQGGGRAVASQSSGTVRRRHARINHVRGHGTPGGRDAAGVFKPVVPPVGQSGGDGIGDRRRIGRCACPRDRPPRPQARQHFPDVRRPREDSRLRPRHPQGGRFGERCSRER